MTSLNSQDNFLLNSLLEIQNIRAEAPYNTLEMNDVSEDNDEEDTPVTVLGPLAGNDVKPS